MSEIQCAHYWADCDMCGRMVVCGKCGNNCCNGGHGTLPDGSDCDACPSAYAMQAAGEPSKENQPGDSPNV